MPVRDGGGGAPGAGGGVCWQRIRRSNINTHHSHTRAGALSSGDVLSHLLASDMCVVISAWHTRCVFLCVCLAVGLEDIHKVY